MESTWLYSHCLIKLAEMFGRPIGRDAFCSRFEHLFPDPFQRYGFLDNAALGQILTLLGLPSTPHPSDDYSVIETEFNANKKIVLVFSRIDLNPRASNVKEHLSLLTAIDPAGFSIWTSCQDGSETTLPLKRSDWSDKGCSGSALY